MTLMRMLWPRALYWAGVVLTTVGLFYAITGVTNAPGPAARSLTQTGGALLAACGVAAILAGKAWMDAVARARTRVACAGCNRRLEATLMHCPQCGAPQRTTPQILHVLADASGGRP